MLSFNEQYNIGQGIFLAFKNNAKKRQFSVNHSEHVREKYRYMFPSRFETLTKENFIMMCLYVCFKKSPSSFEKFIDMLRDIDFVKDVLKFKDTLINYKLYLSRDIDHIRENFGSGSKDILFNEYTKNKINFYTLWFYIKYSGVDYEYSNIQTIHINKIKVMLLYVTFSEQSLNHIKELFNESSLFQ